MNQSIDDKFEAAIITVCAQLEKMLIEKNRKYGNSALRPVNIFAEEDSLTQLGVRMDDKLARIKSSQDNEDEDPYDDLMGYLVLRKVLLKLKDTVD